MAKHKSSMQGTFIVDNQNLRAILKNKEILAVAPVLQSFASTIQDLQPKRRCCGGGGAVSNSQQRTMDAYSAARRAMVGLPRSVLQKIKDVLNTRQIWIPYKDDNNTPQQHIA